MIRRLTKADEAAALAYLAVQPAHSLFLTADILKYGFDAAVFTAWASFDGAGGIEYVFGLFYDCLMLYANNVPDAGRAVEFARYIRENGVAFNVFSVRETLFAPFKGLADFSCVHETRLCALRAAQFVPAPFRADVRTAAPDDIDGIMALRDGIEEFKGLALNAQAMRDVIAQADVSVVRENGRIVSMAMCPAKTGTHANIGGVCTHRRCRKKGYGSCAVSHITARTLAQGLTCVLNYDNPRAGAIYRRMSYRKTGRTSIAVVRH